MLRTDSHEAAVKIVELSHRILNASWTKLNSRGWAIFRFLWNSCSFPPPKICDVENRLSTASLTHLYWLPKAKKPKFSDAVQAERKAFAEEVVGMSEAQLRAKLSFAMDGVVLVVPPKNATERENFCRAKETHCWRKPGEALSEDLLGADAYVKQAKPARCVPLWGGCSASGFAVVCWHENRKLTSEEWAEAGDSGKLAAAIQKVNPGRRAPWSILCDNEGILRAPAAAAMHRRLKVRLWKLPAKSPDLNPVEKFWSWVRKELVRMDLRDLHLKKAAVDRVGFKRRVEGLLKTQKAQLVAKNCAKGLRKVCQKVVDEAGRHSGT